MNERQKKILSDAMHMLATGARRGKRMVDEDAGLRDIMQQVDDLEQLVVAIKSGIRNAAGAGAVLEQVAKRKRTG